MSFIMFNGNFLAYLSWIFVFLACSCIWSPSTKCATHWRFEDGEVNAIYNEIDEIWEKDTLFNILATSTSNIENPSKDNENSSSDMLHLPTQIDVKDSNNQQNINANSRALMINIPAYEKFKAATLTCGEPPNETAIDHLDGIARRFQHPVYAEPEVALLFQKNEFDTVQMDVIEVNLLDALKGENQMVLFNQIANFLRINGDTYHAIECFRKVLTISYNNADALLNLARILYNLRFVNDAIFLAKQSLDHQPPEQTTWLQHYTLGEFFESNGEFERALSHFQMALDQNPAFHPAMISLKKLRKVPIPTSNNFYTVCLILLLSAGFMIYLYYNLFKDPRDHNNNKSNGGGSRLKKPSLPRRSKSSVM
ncbi:uncharacterized protein [Clytia hemisphaerica]|uniref:uncharacterized protein isoform X2 n=1 Tax=Clytia hemisphaerica TaxID=252671 RepID=UPI0034D74AAC